ncbi:hypothetical protein JXA40_05735 [bacterium]|nr:hypothetical protein [candidate division CSSED10-310 bacterium]
MSKAILAWGTAILLALTACPAACAQETAVQPVPAHRMGTLIVKTWPGAMVHIHQLQHEFCFGGGMSPCAVVLPKGV